MDFRQALFACATIGLRACSTLFEALQGRDRGPAHAISGVPEMARMTATTSGIPDVVCVAPAEALDPQDRNSAVSETGQIMIQRTWNMI